jgi:hypothetical protein
VKSLRLISLLFLVVLIDQRQANSIALLVTSAITTIVTLTALLVVITAITAILVLAGLVVAVSST